MVNRKDNKIKQSVLGEITEGWASYKLSEIMEIIGGGTPKTTVAEYWGGEIPWLSVVDFGGGNRWVYKTEKMITQKGLKESSTKILKKGQLIISARGTVGEIAQLGCDMAFNQSCYGLDGKQSIVTNDFLYYLLKISVDDIKRNTHGAVFDTITRQTFDYINVAIPSFQQQRAIAKILSDLDAKIELNRQMNRTLESITQAIFKRWFVDFEFPGHEKTKFVNGLPEGWHINKLGDFAEILNGFAFKSEDFVNSGIFLLRTRNFTEDGYIVRDDTACIPKSFYDEYKDFRLKKFDVLLVMVGASVGKMAIVQSSILPALQNQNMWNFRSKSESGQLFLNFLVKKIVQENMGTASGSARDFFRKDYFRSIDFILPSVNVLKDFDKQVCPIFDCIDKNLTEIQILAQIRDSLLPKLMLGKIRVL